jgi:hypothetical protein
MPPPDPDHAEPPGYTGAGTTCFVSPADDSLESVVDLGACSTFVA